MTAAWRPTDIRLKDDVFQPFSFSRIYKSASLRFAQTKPNERTPSLEPFKKLPTVAVAIAVMDE